MKKNLITALAFAVLPFCLMAQDIKKEKAEKDELKEKAEWKEKAEKKEKVEKKESREIIIRQKGDKDIQLKVEINGDNVTVNGKPLSEFKDDNVIINKRKMMITGDGDRMLFRNFSPEEGEFNFDDKFNEEQWRSNENMLGKLDAENSPSGFLGVTTEEDDAGAKITEVVKGSAAEKAGLKKGDIITTVADEKITGPEVLSDVIGFKKPKDEVKVTFKRAGKESTVKAILGHRKSSGTARSYSFSGPRGQARTFTIPGVAPHVNMEGFGQFDMPAIAGIDGLEMFGRQKRIGLKLQDTEDGVGVKVINVEDSSTAAIAGLKKDDVITEINEKKINNTDDAREELVPEEGKKSYKIKALRNGSEMAFDVKIPRKLKTADF
jgi:serine protease Do